MSTFARPLSLAVFLFLAVSSVGARASHATQCYAWTLFNVCIQWGPSDLPNTRNCTGNGPGLGEVAVYTGTNYTGFCMALKASGHYFGPLGEWDSTWHILSVSSGSKANAIFYSDPYFTTSVGSLYPVQGVADTSAWSISSVNVWQSP